MKVNIYRADKKDIGCLAIKFNSACGSQVYQTLLMTKVNHAVLSFVNQPLYFFYELRMTIYSMLQGCYMD